MAERFVLVTVRGFETLTDEQREILARRFWANVNKSGPTQPHMESPCWVWTACTRKGYGQIRVAGRPERAHRLSFKMAGGAVGDGLFVCHRCDVPACVRPDHLFVGTHAANVEDRDAKGRAASGERNGARLHPDRMPRGDAHGARLHPERLARGDANGARLHPETRARGETHGSALHPEKVPRGSASGMSKLTEDTVREARVRHLNGEATANIARDLGVSRGTVWRVLSGKGWKHVGEPNGVGEAESSAGEGAPLVAPSPVYPLWNSRSGGGR